MSLEISQRLMDHIFEALEEAMLPLKAGQVLTPFTMTITKEGVVLQRFVDQKLNDAIERARRKLHATDEDTLAYALVFDAVITLDDRDVDAVLIEAGERGASGGYRFAQRYQARQGSIPLFTIGKLSYMGAAENYLR